MAEPSTQAETKEEGQQQQLNASKFLPIFRNVQTAQAKRVAEYSSLNSIFHQLLATGDEVPYRKQLARSTEAFQACSLSVRQAINDLEQYDAHSALAQLLCELQRHEQSRLRYTLILQALKKAGSEGKFSWQQRDASRQPAPEHGHTTADTVHSCCALHVSEPTAEELQNAMSEATQGLQAATESINDTLEEIRYVEEDLREEMERQ